MPRSGGGVYSLPALPADGESIEAADVNVPLRDIETDLNAARPVAAGGTGQTSVAGVQTAFKIAPYDDAATISASWTYTAEPVFDGGARWNDSDMARFGTDNDAHILHDGTNFTIRTSTGGLFLQSVGNLIALQHAAGTTNALVALSGGAVTLYHNAIAKMATSSIGVTVIGAASADTIAGNWIASQAEAEAGSSSTKVMTPQRVSQAIAALSSPGGWELVSQFYTGASSASVDTPDFVSGYDYAVEMSWVYGSTNPTTLLFAPYRVVAASRPTAVALKASDSNYTTGWLEILHPMDTRDQHHISWSYAAFPTNNTTSYFGSASGTFAARYLATYGAGSDDRISSLRFTRGSGNVSGGTMRLYRRPTRVT